MKKIKVCKHCDLVQPHLHECGEKVEQEPQDTCLCHCPHGAIMCPSEYHIKCSHCQPKTEGKCGKWDCRKNHNHLGQHWEEGKTEGRECGKFGNPNCRCNFDNDVYWRNCPIHQPAIGVSSKASPKQDNWEERYFTSFAGILKKVDYEDVMDFIRSELQRERQEIIEILTKKMKGHSCGLLDELLDELDKE